MTAATHSTFAGTRLLTFIAPKFANERLPSCQTIIKTPHANSKQSR